MVRPTNVPWLKVCAKRGACLVLSCLEPKTIQYGLWKLGDPGSSGRGATRAWEPEAPRTVRYEDRKVSDLVDWYVRPADDSSNYCCTFDMSDLTKARVRAEP